MSAWRSQPYIAEGKSRGISDDILQNAVSTAAYTLSVNRQLEPILTLGHLAQLAQTDYALLRAIASRRFNDPYKVFRIKKRPSSDEERRFRVICVPDPQLMQTQRWLAQRVLAHGTPHDASFAYAPGSKIIDAARQHCEARWLIKLDIKNFFESISEIDVYRVFRELGYQALVSFEMARLCTRLGTETLARMRSRWRAAGQKYNAVPEYRRFRLGHLPQGAPTSPMLANMAVRSLDQRITSLALELGLTYTRYADDLALSTKAKMFSRENAQHVIKSVYRIIGTEGFSPNVTKTALISPGARKIVLGLLVNGKVPRLSREFRQTLRQHLYFLSTVGPVEHARKRGFAAVAGLRHHVEGLVRFASGIDGEFGRACSVQLKSVKWPF